MNDKSSLLKTVLFPVVLTMVFACQVSAQKSLENLEQDYQRTVQGYIQELQNNFAMRYISGEQFLIDQVSIISDEYSIRKGKGLIRGGLTNTSGSFRLSDSLQSKMKNILTNLSNLQRFRKLVTGEQMDEQTLKALQEDFEKTYAKEFEIARRRVMSFRDELLSAGNATDNRRLFQNQLEAAFKRFLKQDFECSILEFNDVMNTYRSTYKDWDDVLYYFGEAYFNIGDVDNAETQYARILSDYPSSKFTERALYKLITLSHVRTDRLKMSRYLPEFEKRVTRHSKNSQKYDQMLMMGGLTYFETSDYMRAIETLTKINASSAYYSSALYLLGHCYANREDYAKAMEAFQKVEDLKTVKKSLSLELNKQLIELARLKMAFIHFELSTYGQKFKNVHPLISRISEQSEYYPLALLTASWAAFKDNSIDTARMYVDSLIRTFPQSEYIFEAKTLLGNIDVLDPRLTDRDRELAAIESYNYVAQAMEARYLADEFIEERDSTLQILNDLVDIRRTAALRNDSAGFVRYDAMYQLLEMALTQNGFSMAANDNPRQAYMYHQLSELISQLRIVQGKLKDAEDAKDVLLMRSLNKQIVKIVNKIENLGLEQFSTYSIAGADSGTIAKRDRTIKDIQQRLTWDKFKYENQIAETERLIREAQQANRQEDLPVLQRQLKAQQDSMTVVLERERILNSIDLMNADLIQDKYLSQALSDVMGSDFSKLTIDNYSSIELQAYFTQHRLARLNSEIEARTKRLNIMREKISREKEQVLMQLNSVDELMKIAEEQKRTESIIRLADHKNRLTEIYYRICDYELILGTQPQMETYADLNLWGDFAIYGRNNITYVINTSKTENIHELARAIDQIDKVLIGRRKNYESRIAKLEEEIRLKEQEIRDKELREMRSSQRTFFETEYFQAKETEQPEDDPFEYKDIIPEVIVVKDTLEGKTKKKKEEVLDELQDTTSAGVDYLSGDSAATSTDSAGAVKEVGTDGGKGTKETDTTTTGSEGGVAGDSTSVDENEEAPGATLYETDPFSSRPDYYTEGLPYRQTYGLREKEIYIMFIRKKAC